MRVHFFSHLLVCFCLVIDLHRCVRFERAIYTTLRLHISFFSLLLLFSLFFSFCIIYHCLPSSSAVHLMLNSSSVVQLLPVSPRRDVRSFLSILNVSSLRAVLL